MTGIILRSCCCLIAAHGTTRTSDFGSSAGTVRCCAHGLIEDTDQDLWTSGRARDPTLETRVFDCCTHLDDRCACPLTCPCAHLYSPARYKDLRQTRASDAENRWRRFVGQRCPCSNLARVSSCRSASCREDLLEITREDSLASIARRTALARAAQRALAASTMSVSYGSLKGPRRLALSAGWGGASYCAR